MTMSFFQLVFWGVFVMGTVGLFLNRRNFVVMLMCIELMLLAVNTVFLTLSLRLDDLNGRLMALYVMTLALAETALGLALCVLHYRTRLTLDIEYMNLLKG
uniref:NADH dehydrogenase subunit 4L n=1 Tax=Neochloris aquatica TaxID=3099 RepID=A0A076VG30_9CHLO|nr:NADH dehydrogenase subunit 4L [Neochloris aquatica]AIK29155.1 NADH dehydrogenase subunit 4L [Neochloris aquatica]